jgi:hypothetical protein
MNEMNATFFLVIALLPVALTLLAAQVSRWF